jgi:GNAT superfamily N-acetyltransferase
MPSLATKALKKLGQFLRVATEVPSFPELELRIDSSHKIYLVENPTRGLNIVDEDDDDWIGWDRYGYTGGEKDNRFAIEVRARNNRVMAAVAWWADPKRPGVITTKGTYVSKTLRRRGLGEALWRSMIRASGCTKIISEPVTDEGFTLVISLMEKLKHDVVIELVDDAGAVSDPGDLDMYDLRFEDPPVEDKK